MVHGSHEGASSSASSALTVEAPTPEGMLVQEVDVEVIDGKQGTASAIPTPRGNDEESKQHLREQLRRTLNKKESSHADQYSPRHRQEDEASDNFTSTIGVMQALVSIFLDDGDKLRCINAGNTRITFLLRPPLYYACVSSWGEAESVQSKTRFHLEYLHLQILSVVSAEQLRRMFERRNNFDLRRLLSGTEPLLHSLLGRLEWDIAMSTSSLHCLKMEPMLRKSIADVLVPTSKIKDILYVILIAQGKVITLVRPKKHSIHPSDLHILVNTIHSPSIINSSAAASWLPVCLPKFNSAAFVNAYVMFLRKEDQTQEQQNQHRKLKIPLSSSQKLKAVKHWWKNNPLLKSVSNWCNTINQRLMQDGLLGALTGAISRGETEYAAGDLGVPGLRHFVYKSRSHVQVTMPLFEDPYDNSHEKRRLTTLYQTLYDAIHAKSGQGSTLKLQYIRTERESVMGWITQPFELYLALSPLLPKSGIVNTANAVANTARCLAASILDTFWPHAYLLNRAGAISSPSEFLKAIGRSADTKVTAETWKDLWAIDGLQLKKAGLAVRDRRYILWSMEKFRQGEDPAQFAHPPTPKKKIRGHGPAVQNDCGETRARISRDNYVVPHASCLYFTCGSSRMQSSKLE
ncbi:predicted protein [Postia placenta Mad-698-R]|nr:predicted protein [Postia placenta Mad-698-R]